MGYCTNCGQPTDRPDNICNICAGQSVQQSSFNQPQNGDNFDVANVKEEQKDYWAALFANPIDAFNKAYKGEKPFENDFDISMYEKKFNWGAFFGNNIWLAFNCNFWLGLICYFVSGIPIIGWIAFLVIWFYLGFNGNKITYRTRAYGTLENFKKNQKIWAWVMPCIFFGSFAIFFFMLGLSFLSSFMR